MISKAIPYLAAWEATLSVATSVSTQASSLEHSSSSSSTLTCSAGHRYRPALVCGNSQDTSAGLSGPEDVRRVRRLHRQATSAARSGFVPELLAGVLEDALALVDAWKKYLPSSQNLVGLIYDGAMPVGPEIFTRQLWQDSAGKEYPTPSSYCLYAHVLAIFVVARLSPLLFAGQELGLHGHGMWVVRAGLRGADMKLPESLTETMRRRLVDGLLLFGKDRVLDQMHLAGWPLGAAEVTELKELLRALCEGRGQREGRCTVGAFERAAVSRFRRVRHLGGVRIYAPSSSWWDDGWQGRLQPWTGTTNPSRPPPTGLGAGLRTIMLGTHGALMNELQQSWRAAATQADLGSLELSFHVVGNFVYDPNKWLKKWVGSPPMTMEHFLKSVPFEVVNHQYIDPASLRGSVWNLMKKHVRPGDAISLVCTIPSVTCAALASMPWPVVLFAPTGVTVQVPREHYAPFLKLLVRMAQDPKNHLIAMGPYTRAQIEYHTSLRVPVIPVLALYVNVSYTGRFSKDVLVHDRTSTLLTQTLCALVPDTFPLRMVGFLQTDRQYSTFARHRAVVHVPGCLPEQMAFYEFYGMGIPLFIPADPTYYLWPRLPFSMGEAAPPSSRKCGSYSTWAGTHQLQFSDPVTKMLVYANYSIRCSGKVIVHTASDSEALTQSSEVAKVVPLDAMDELGNTHALRPAAGSELHSHNGRCVRFTRWPVSDQLRAWIGPSAGVCPTMDAAGGCKAGPTTACPGVPWVEASYLAAPPPAVVAGPAQREEPVQFERGGFGGTFWHLGSTTLSRRRRGHRPSTSPFDLNTHRTLREWSVAIDFFRYPALTHFVSLAALMRQLLSLDPVQVGAKMREFRTERRQAGLAAWRTTLEKLVRHESQSALV